MNILEVLANEEEDNTDKSCCVDDFSNSSRIKNIPKNRSSVLNELEVSLDLSEESLGFDLLNQEDVEILTKT